MTEQDEIKVYKADGTQTTYIRWISMTHWMETPIERYISVPGGRGLGRSFLQGYDNAVTTVTGQVQWDALGTAEVDALNGQFVSVETPAEGLRTGRASITLSGSSGPWMAFSMTVREEEAPAPVGDEEED